MGQQPNITSVVNAASFQVGYGPAMNTYISIFGTNLASTTRTWTGSDFVNGQPPQVLDGVAVGLHEAAGYSACAGEYDLPPCSLMNSESITLYIEYVSPTQINALVPGTREPGNYTASGAFSLAVATGVVCSTSACTYSGMSNFFSTAIQNPVQAGYYEVIMDEHNCDAVAGTCSNAYVTTGILAPAFFVVGPNYVAARHADGALAGKANMIPGVVSWPAAPGEIIELYGNGFGPGNPGDLLESCVNFVMSSF